MGKKTKTQQKAKKVAVRSHREYQLLTNETKAAFESLTVKKQNKKDVKTLFSISTEPNAAMKKKLENDRFRKKILEGNESKYEERTMHKITKHLPQAQEIKPKIVESKKPEVYDIWAADVRVEKRPVHQKNSKSMEIPTVVPPHPGQSINPTMDSQKHLMSIAVEHFEKKPEIHNTRESRITGSLLVKRVPKPRTKKEKEEFEKMEKLRQDKEERKVENMAGKLAKDLKKEFKAHGSFIAYSKMREWLQKKN